MTNLPEFIHLDDTAKRVQDQLNKWSKEYKVIPHGMNCYAQVQRGQGTRTPYVAVMVELTVKQWRNGS
jgi:hypothetical protein